MAKIDGYKDLIAWQKAMDLVESVYRSSSRFPPDERFGLTSQIRRAAVSIPCNIAEGYSRPSKADYIRFLEMARGSANEVETQLRIALRLGFVAAAQTADTMSLTKEIQRILKGLVDGLHRTRRSTARPGRA